MSEGEQIMDSNRRAANARQLVASSARDCAAAPNKYPRQYAGPRRDFNVGGRPFVDAIGITRKPVQSRGRFSDKRPRFRGPNGNDTKEEVTQVEAPVPEYGSVQVWGSKKSNLNHLLNFHFESRDVHHGRGGLPGYGYGPGRYGNRRGGGSSCSTYNKERFLQANCQFVVHEGGDYSVHAVDPDVLVDWDHIEQVRIFGHQVPSCPICLYPPKAAKMTRCGHIYCWSCMLHYLSLDDRSWRKCPICYEAVHAKDLKSVSALETHHYSVGEQITMKLMKKPRGTLRVMPAATAAVSESLTVENSSNLPANVNDVTLACYSKLLSANVQHIQSITDSERVALLQQLKEEGEGSLEGSFITVALASLSDREMKLQSVLSGTLRALSHDNKAPAVGATALPRPPELVVDASPAPLDHLSSMAVEHRYVCAFDDETEDFNSETSSTHAVDGYESDAAAEVVSGIAMTTMPGIPMAVQAAIAMETGERGRMLEVSSSPAILMLSTGDNNDSRCGYEEDVEGLMEDLSLTKDDVSSNGEGRGRGARPDNAFYFYQAADGQHIYMHAVNIHCMVKQYGSLANCPPVVTATIVEMESISMDEELRRRLRYLSHLPLTCEFVMAELDLVPPLVSPVVLSLFKDELERRKQNRQKRARSEKKHATRIQREENKSLGIDPTMRIVRSEFARPVAPLITFGSQGHVPADDLGSLPTNQSNVECIAAESWSGSGSFDACGSSGGGGHSSQDSSSTSPTTMSFAQMLKGGKSRQVSESWPKVVKVGAAGGGGSVTVDGKSLGRRASGSVGDSDGDEYQPVRRLDNSLSDAIQAALDSYQCHKEPGPVVSVDGVGVEQAGGTTAGGKKKNKKKLLFSTSLPRSK